jgi:VIT1/CCC1 family predicted Fe2+/Mn2+ transporter
LGLGSSLQFFFFAIVLHMKAYLKSVSHLVGSVSSESPEVALLRKVCQESKELTGIHAKLQKILDTHEHDLKNDQFDLFNKTQSYNAITVDLTALTKAKDFDVRKLDASLRKALKAAKTLLVDIESSVRTKEEQQKRELDRAAEIEASEKKRIADEEQARSLERERLARHESEKADLSNRNALALKELVDKLENWKHSVLAYQSSRIVRLLGGLFGFIAVFFLFSSWRAGPPGLVLLGLLVLLIGPSRIDGMAKRRLWNSDNTFSGFDNVLAWQIGSVVGLLQIVVGAIVSLMLWMFDMNSGFWRIFFPLGWPGVFGYLIVLPCVLFVAWLFGGFYVGLAASRVTRRVSIANTTLYGTLKLTCPHCRSGQEVLVVVPSSGPIACATCGSNILD